MTQLLCPSPIGNFAADFSTGRAVQLVTSKFDQTWIIFRIPQWYWLCTIIFFFHRWLVVWRKERQKLLLCHLKNAFLRHWILEPSWHIDIYLMQLSILVISWDGISSSIIKRERYLTWRVLIKVRYRIISKALIEKLHAKERDVCIIWGFFLNQMRRLFMDDFYAYCKYITYFYTCTQLEKYLK